MKVLNAEQTRNLEKNAVRSGISYLQLMENAGAAAARFIKKRFPVDQKHIVVLCGKGNNGGDGFVAARHLPARGGVWAGGYRIYPYGNAANWSTGGFYASPRICLISAKSAAK